MTTFNLVVPSIFQSSTPAFKGAFLAYNHLYASVFTVSQAKLHFARMCRQSHVWEGARWAIDLEEFGPPTMTAFLPWSNQEILFCAKHIIVVGIFDEANTPGHSPGEAGEVMQVFAVNLPDLPEVPLPTEWKAVAVDVEARLLYVQFSVTVPGEPDSRKLSIFSVDVASQDFDRFLLERGVSTEEEKEMMVSMMMKPALFMDVAWVNSQKRLFIGVKELSSNAENGRELMSLSTIVSILLLITRLN